MTTATRICASVSLAAVVAATASAALAATDSPATQSVGAVAEIVITAQRREESLERVPVAVSAMTGQALEAQGVVGFADLSERIPSLRFGWNGGGEYIIAIRGLSGQNVTPGGDSPVAYNVNGVYLEQTTAVDPEYYDVQRVEVLRGPQGTLYGRNSVGGSINVVTEEPANVFAASADALVGNYDAYTFRSWITGPLFDSGGVQVDARLTGVWAHHSGYTTNLSTAPTASHDLDSMDYWLVRPQLKFVFGSNVDLLLFANFTHNSAPAAANTAWWEAPFRFTNPPLGIAPGSPCDFSTAALFQPRTVCQDSPAISVVNTQLYSATLNWRLPFATFTSVTGYETGHDFTVQDGDGANVPIFFNGPWQVDNAQFSQEFRLASHDDQPLRWLAGFIYFHASDVTNFFAEDTGFNDIFPKPGGGDEFTLRDGGTVHTDSWAPFGQADFDFAKTHLGVPLTISLGLRYTHDHKDGFNFLNEVLPAISRTVALQGPWSRTWDKVTGKLSAQYQFTGTSMGYVSAAHGYVSGGETVGVGNVYDPETLWSYEAGLKTRLLDDRLQLNIAAYYETIEHLQVFVQNAIASGISNVNGKTPVYGVETEINYNPLDNLRLNAAITLTDAHYGTYISKDNRFSIAGPGCDAVTHLCDFKGNALNQTPPYTVDLGAEYIFHTTFGTITPRVDAFFSGKVNFLADNYFTSVQAAYHETNISVTWNSTDGHYRIEAFAKNLENANVIASDGLQSISLGQGKIEPDRYTYYPPRTFGVRFAVNVGP